MKWIVRFLRGALLVAVVVTIVTTTNLMLESASSGQAKASQPSTEMTDEEAANPESDGAIAQGEFVLGTDEPLDDPSILIDSLGGDLPKSADSADQPLGESAPSAVDLVAAVSVAPSGLELFSSEASGAAKYRKVDLATLSYGQGAANLGLVAGSERKPEGPASFTIDRSGVIYVSDNINGRVQVFSALGKHLRSFQVEARVHDLVVADSEEIYILSEDGRLHVHDKASGKFKANWSLSGKAAESLGQLRNVGGQVNLESPRQETQSLAVATGAASRVLSAGEQGVSQKKGAKANGTDYYTTSYRDGGHLYRYDDKGKAVQDIALRLPDVATVVFLTEDKSGSLYVQVERIGADEQVSVEVRQFSKKGELTAVVPLERVDYVQMTRSAIVTENGDIYQLLPTRQGVSLVKWQRS